MPKKLEAEAPEDELDVIIDPTIKGPDEDEDSPEAIVAQPVEEKPAPAKIVEPEEGIETVKAQLDAERSARLQAEANARKAATDAAQARGDVQENQIALVTNAIETTKANLVNAKSAYAQAMTDGDYAAAADAQEAISEHKTKQLQLEAGLQQLKTAPKPQPQIQPINDPVEALAVQLPPQSAAWVRAHPEYARDNEKYASMIAAHNLVVGKDRIAPDTPAYFQAVENYLGIGQTRVAPKVEPQEDESALSLAARPTQARTAPPAMPVERSNGGGSHAVRLSAAEAEMAEMMFPDEYKQDPRKALQAYAQNKAALEREGKLGKLN